MIDTNPHNIADQLNKVPDDALYHDATKTLMLKTLKTLWCSRANYNYTLLEHFLRTLRANELVEFVEKIHIKPPPPWIFDNTCIINEHRSRVPQMFVYLNTDNNKITDELSSFIENVIDTLGQYCIDKTKHILERIAVNLFRREYINDRQTFCSILRAELQKENFLLSPPLRDDVCYRFTKLCMLLIQKVRDSI
ncbi:PrGVORF67 [Pieris rapae granulovirus Wuhan]|uniref:PrGVORF67 n=1 Tax=Pieris rapae granulovirus Wuhan TaxID=2848030 RepID=D2J4N4_9BBAC|nr:PrGVORF67 [Betabaculovirus arrapae]ACZ63553.1 PrGVORF67 [Betabaculovirus arrapae]UOS85742.1 ORF67 [Pieris rapae granulovirus]